MKPNEVTFKVDMPDNLLALAIAGSDENTTFISVNHVFSTFFPTLHSPKDLVNLVISKTENKTIIEYNNSHWELMDIRINLSDTLYLLKNVTFEMLILKQLKKQLTELTASQKMYSDILEKDLPIGIMVVGKNFDVIYANYTVKRFFHVPSMVNMEKCYNYFKLLEPCNDCFLKDFAQGGGRKKTFKTDDNRMITTDAHPMDDSFVITFRDTTREIHLITEIKRQHEELQNANLRIADQNDILKRLSNINLRLGQIRNLEEILETVVVSIMDTFSCGKGALLLFNEAGTIRNAHFSETISHEETEFIIRYIDTCGINPNGEDSACNNNLAQTLPGFISLEMNNDKKNNEPGQAIGRIFLYEPAKTIDPDILKLFLMQVSVYIENLDLHRKLEEIAQKDSLTGVSNRYYFGKQFTEEVELSLRFGQPLSLILIDMNGLKEINDHAGHVAGDRVLFQTARLLEENVHSLGSVFRIGGDEFIVLLPNCPETRLRNLMEKLIAIQSNALIEYEGNNYSLRFCLGGACSANIPHDQLQCEADKRMYAQKTEYYTLHKKYRKS